MTISKSFFLAVGLGAALLLATAGANPALAQTEEVAAETVGDDTAQADAYYYVLPDFRRCEYPYCGGVFVRKVNRLFTLCPGGYYSPVCYVAEFDRSGLGLADALVGDDLGFRQLLVRGELSSNTSEGYDGFGRLAATEAWSSPTISLFGGQVVRIQSTGLQCFTFPCENLVATEINGNRSIPLADVQFNDCAGDDSDIDDANTQLFSDDGLLAIGRPVTVTGPAGEATGAAVSQFFTRIIVAAEPETPEDPPREP